MLWKIRRGFRRGEGSRCCEKLEEVLGVVKALLAIYRRPGDCMKNSLSLFSIFFPRQNFWETNVCAGGIVLHLKPVIWHRSATRFRDSKDEFVIRTFATRFRDSFGDSAPPLLGFYGTSGLRSLLSLSSAIPAELLSRILNDKFWGPSDRR